MVEEIFNDIVNRMHKTIETIDREFSHIRTGRATPALLDRIMVDAYSAKMPINQLATISIPQPRTIIVMPFDKSNLPKIEKAINASDLGINPNNDGKNIILEIPMLTEERRKDLAKVIHKKAEESKIAIRNIRREGKEKIEKMEEEKKITEDELKKNLDKLQKHTDDFIKKIDDIVVKKEKEIMSF